VRLAEREDHGSVIYLRLNNLALETEPAQGEAPDATIKNLVAAKYNMHNFVHRGDNLTRKSCRWTCDEAPISIIIAFACTVLPRIECGDTRTGKRRPPLFPSSDRRPAWMSMMPCIQRLMCAQDARRASAIVVMAGLYLPPVAFAYAHLTEDAPPTRTAPWWGGGGGDGMV
jgi:hypothetical protein